LFACGYIVFAADGTEIGGIPMSSISIERSNSEYVDEIQSFARRQGRAVKEAAHLPRSSPPESCYVLVDESTGYECFPFGTTIQAIAWYLETYTSRTRASIPDERRVDAS
jgi:hypothetical protein